MLEAAKAAMSFVAGRQRADLDGDAQLRFAVIHAIELVGEASHHVSEELRARHPEVPWRQIGRRETGSRTVTGRSTSHGGS
jgi:uncharacterized protein with HEPN domain